MGQVAMKCFMEAVRSVETGHVGESRREHISTAKEGGSMDKGTETRTPLRSWLGSREGLTLPGMEKTEKAILQRDFEVKL